MKVVRGDIWVIRCESDMVKGLPWEFLVVQDGHRVHQKSLLPSSNVWWDQVKIFAALDYPFLSHFHCYMIKEFPGVLKQYFSRVANVQNMMREPEPGSKKMTTLAKKCMRSIDVEGTKNQWEDLDLFVGTCIKQGWLPIGCKACTFRTVFGLPEPVYHVDYVMTAGSFLIGIVVHSSEPYTLKFLKNPILAESETRTEANPRETREESLRTGSVYCLFGPILAVPHCPVPQRPGASRKIFLIGGHTEADLTSGKTENLHAGLMKNPMYYHFNERRGNFVPRTAERE